MSNDTDTIDDVHPTKEDDPTSELESLDQAHDRDPAIQDSAGLDEDTSELEYLDDFASKNTNLQSSDAGSRHQSISQLQDDIEQLHARWSGLEKEIKARETLTTKLQQSLTETRQKLALTESSLSEREHDVDSLQACLKEKSSLLTSIRKEANNIHTAVDSGKNLITELRSKIEAQQSTIMMLSGEKMSAGEEIKTAIKLQSSNESRITELADALSRKEKSLEQQRSTVLQLNTELSQALHNNQELRNSLDSIGTPDDKQYRILLAAQEARIAGYKQDITALRQQIARTESYADTLRTQLQDIAVSSSDGLRHSHQLELSMEAAATQITQLKTELQQETRVSASLRQKNRQLKAEHDNEIRQIRFELGSAKETIAGQENLSEQLASDLIDNQGYRQALESQLESIRKKNREKTDESDRKLKKLERANEELARELENKDSAIAALLREVATRSHTIDSIGEIKNVIHEIDGRMSDRISDDPAYDKDRRARLLIGNVDGQELQFPLFRRRLTIGRTAHNDIQLKAEYISRRHAVIVTENEQTRIIDWGSRNGVYVNHLRVAEQILNNGDIVAIGTAEFRYEERSKR